MPRSKILTVAPNQKVGHVIVRLHSPNRAKIFVKCVRAGVLTAPELLGVRLPVALWL